MCVCVYVRAHNGCCVNRNSPHKCLVLLRSSCRCMGSNLYMIGGNPTGRDMRTEFYSPFLATSSLSGGIPVGVNETG